MITALGLAFLQFITFAQNGAAFLAGSAFIQQGNLDFLSMMRVFLA